MRLVLAVSNEVPWSAVSAGHHLLDIEPGTGARRSPAGPRHAR